MEGTVSSRHGLIALALAIGLWAKATVAQVPNWPATYQMNQSTILMVCNYSGYTDPQSTKGWTIVDFDWSNSRTEWAAAKPMDCEERLITQVNMTHAASPGTTSFVYRNAIKALPWYTSIRVKLQDPDYAPWFLRFSGAGGYHVPQCDANYNPPLCSDFYHDQTDTPGYPHGYGDCTAPGCDCGLDAPPGNVSIPCGEYLFDFRAVNVSVNGQTLIDWYINDYFFSVSGAGNPLVGGFYVDDSWGPGGPTEMEGHAVVDMGLSQADVNAITSGYAWAQQQLYAVILARGKFIWDLFLNIDPYAPLNGDCPQPWVRNATCATDLRRLCNPDNQTVLDRALLYGFSPGSCTGTDPANLVEAAQDVANFLLIRGPHAYLGNGWLACDRQYEYPADLFNADYGEPVGICSETSPGSGVFVRDFTKSTVQMDCNTWTPTVTFK